jgi:hypothetical protein
MDKDSLRELVNKLHAEMSEALRADPKSRDHLSNTMQDIRRMIDETPAQSAAGTRRSLPDRLERLAVQFEADHPTLAASARQLVDLLGEVGI